MINLGTSNAPILPRGPSLVSSARDSPQVQTNQSTSLRRYLPSRHIKLLLSVTESLLISSPAPEHTTEPRLDKMTNHSATNDGIDATAATAPETPAATTPASATVQHVQPLAAVFVHQGMAAAIYNQAFPRGHIVIPNSLAGVENIVSAVVTSILKQTDVLDTNAPTLGPTNHKPPVTVANELMTLASADAVRAAYAVGRLTRASAHIPPFFEVAAVALHAWGRGQMPARVVQLMLHDEGRGPRHVVLVQEEPGLYVWVEGIGGGGYRAMEPVPTDDEQESVKSLINDIQRLEDLVKSLKESIRNQSWLSRKQRFQDVRARNREAREAKGAKCGGSA